MLEGLTPGAQLPRREIHQRFGGRPQSGISPSSRARVVMFFAVTNSPPGTGFFGGLGDDGFLHYFGEGQNGDQQFTQGNKAILNHQQDGRTLEGFVTGQAGATYLGEFTLADFYQVDAPDPTNPHLLRQVIVFRLEPLGDLPVPLPRAPYAPARVFRIEAAPLMLSSERHQPLRRSSRAEKNELADRYTQYLERIGHETRMLRILPPEEAQPFSPSLWDDTARELVEIKAQVTRDQIRSAIGALLDCARFVNAAGLVLLVPTRPRPDLLALLKHTGITVVYEDDNGWVREEPATDKTSSATGAGPVSTTPAPNALNAGDGDPDEGITSWP
ncbi:hypothetical protein P3102_07685 [Amycolatopsis sp. QT-25]|uniref:hypothetical protein n=1 Tax=Amycolatopsis sp. QT-25 TaxID=3034022 RepID=UPI0023ED0D22|nr:hypothetical protein [Amycolatopsis sp. QT-25]WET81096.1 hypothetical protein P3102_07685 [Amycolatopsis sp. QT-25]